MPLTPIDVQQKTFGTALRGYDLDEVDDFLDEIVTSLKDYEQRLRDAQERIAALEAELNDRGDAEGAIARALVAAQRSADAIIEESRQEASNILESARTQANEISTRHMAEQAEATSQIDTIRGHVNELRARLRLLSEQVGEHIVEMDEALDEASGHLGEAFDHPEQVTDQGIFHSWSAPDEPGDEPMSPEVTEAEPAFAEFSEDDGGDTGQHDYAERVMRPWEQT